MDEQTWWLNDLLDRFHNVLQDRFDTLFENDLHRSETLFKTLAQQRAAFFQKQSDVYEALFGDKNNQAIDTVAGDQEDPDVNDKQENQDDSNIAIPKVLEESILHTSDTVEVVPTSMVATYEEYGCQESVNESGIYESDISGLVPQLRDAKDEQYRAMLDAYALRAKLKSLQQQVINDDIGAITLKGGPPDHMQASEKELCVFKSLLEEESLFGRQKGMLRRQEQQQLAKDAKDQRRLWNPRIKIILFLNITLREMWF
ncbi:hypothetical protein Tco_0154295 [Tanacetum coccineum]